MSGNWHWRRPHNRTLRSGRVIAVSGTYYWKDAPLADAAKSRVVRSNLCPYCHANIHTYPTKSGGWVHFEKGMAHLRILHSCFTIGRGMSKRRANAVRDLFEEDLDIEEQ